jgi:hypothetical protein
MDFMTAFDVAPMLGDRGIDLASLGAAYLALLANVVLAIAAFVASRSYLVVSPNRSAKDYGVYGSLVFATLIVATVLENELLPRGYAALQYVTLPQLLLLLVMHLWISYRQEPWLIALGAASIVGAVAVVALTSAIGAGVRIAHWVTSIVLIGLLVFLWVKSISTKRGFMNAESIYVGSKETLDAVAAPQKPWLGLPAWVALVAASVVLAVLNSILRGRALGEIPAIQVILESSIVIVVTALVCAVPATTYWLARRAWMPELTRFVWLVWIVVGFAFTYGNYLTSLDRA